MKLAKILLLAITTTGIVVAPDSALACSDYSTQAEARASGDRRLDGDGDGIYCEHLPAGYSAPTQQRQSVIPGWVYLAGSEPGSRVNVRSGPSITDTAIHYGLVGDRVWASRTTHSSGYTWYFVGFPASGASGWVRGDLISF
jgi:hypothetical protein